MATIITDNNIHDLVRKYLLNKKVLPKDLRDRVLNDWDVSHVTDMNKLFSILREDDDRLTKILTDFNEPLDRWNVSNVTNMFHMFDGCNSFNQPLNYNPETGAWNVSNVEDMEGMFENCTHFNQPLDGWNVIRVEYMSFMFLNCSAFNQPLNNWNVENIIKMEAMFANCASFNKPLDRWNVSKVNDMTLMFTGCVSFNQPINMWVLNIRVKMINMYNNCGISEANKARLTEQQQLQIQRQQQIRLQRDIANRTHNMIEAQPQETSEFPECIICGDILNNEIGPGPGRACVENCNDAVNVCENGHIFHRGCILNACNAEAVDVISQMGFDPSGYAREQQRRNKCPQCQTELNPTCEQLIISPAVSIDELKEYKKQNGGKKKRKNTRKKGKRRNIEKKRKNRKTKRR